MPEPEPQFKRAMVLPVRRCVDVQKISKQMPPDNSQDADRRDSISLGDMDSDDDRSSLNIYNPSKDKDKNTKCTMDGYYPNAFLAKKLLTEGLLNENNELKPTEQDKLKPPENKEPSTKEKPVEKEKEVVIGPSQKKLLSNKIEESDTQVIIKKDKEVVDDKGEKQQTKKRKIPEGLKVDIPVAKKRRPSPIVFDVDNSKKREEKEPIEKERVGERTESASSVTVRVATVTNTHKYDSVPPLRAPERKQVWCRAFPRCRYGNACAFAHPRCKFAAACTRRNSCVYSHAPNALAPPTTSTSPVTNLSAAERKLVWCRAFPKCRYNYACAFAHPRCKFGAACKSQDCVYSHAPNAPALPTTSTSPVIASYVVPATNYKTISTAVPNMCKFYPNCLNPACHYYHPKPCRNGKSCVNKLECYFYHADVPAKWK